jgi:hypothetical protein
MKLQEDFAKRKEEVVHSLQESFEDLVFQENSQIHYLLLLPTDL